MYSGSDSTESLKKEKWPPINQMFPNSSNDQIDWAALAQQWIIMKEAGPPVPNLGGAPPSPPPPPNIKDHNKEDLSEGGEAPMEVENEKEDNAQWNQDASSPEGSWNWSQQQQWGYSWNATVPTKAPLLPIPASYNQYSTAPVDTPSNFQYNSKPTNSEYSSSYWSSGGNKSKPHNKRFSKVNTPQKHSTPPTPSPAESITLDANKRKQLPAWIRDGLEKMERDKLKQIEKEKQKQETVEDLVKPKFNQKEALEIIKSTVKHRERSKFDSDGEDSNNDIRYNKKQATPERSLISHEDMMLRIRRAMTEILLKVTNQEIMGVCKEAFQRHLRKGKASDHRVSASSGNNLSTKLGVGIYGGSGSSSDESDSKSGHERLDSEEELKATIRRRKAEFVKTEREIEQRLAGSENMSDNRAVTPDTYQSQVDHHYQDYEIRPGSDTAAARYNSSKQSVSKVSLSNSSESDSEASDKRCDTQQSKRLSNSESTNQKYNRDYLKQYNKSESPERDLKQNRRHSNDRKYVDLHRRNRRSRSKSNSSRRNRSRSRDRDRYQDFRNSKLSSKRSRSRSSSRSYQSTESNSRRSDSYSAGVRSRRSRSRSRSRNRKSDSSERSAKNSRKSRSSRRSRSYSPDNYYRRSRSHSSSRGKRSRRR